MVDVTVRKSQMLNVLKTDFCNKFGVDLGSTILLGFHGDGVAHHKGLKQASTEVYSWNYLAQKDGERNLFTKVP